MGYGGRNKFVINPSTGRVEEWHVGYTSEKGFSRGKSTGNFFIREVPEMEWAEMKVAEEIQAANYAAQQAAIAEEKIIADYFSALPLEISVFRRGRGREIEDNYGNYVLTIPQKAALENWSIKELVAWMDDQTTEGYGD
ncbi:MAG: hypothetical protein WC332_02175 [Clostridia bacterium]|jgi:hypothetical protein